MKVGDFDFENLASISFCNWVALTECNAEVEEMIARALTPTRRNDPKVVEAWMTPAFLLAWDLMTWLDEIIAEWCRTHLPDDDPCGYLRLVGDRIVGEDHGGDAKAVQVDPDRNLLFAVLTAVAAWDIDFDKVAEVLLTGANQQDVMHTPFRELGLVQPGQRADLQSLPDRPKHEQPLDKDGALTTKGMMQFGAYQRFDDLASPAELPSEPPNHFSFWPSKR